MTPTEFKTIFDTHRMRVYFFCLKIMHQCEDAEDITIHTFTKLWEFRDKVAPESIQAFLMISARHKCLDYIKSKNVRDKTLKSYGEEIETELIEIKYEVLDHIYQLIENLPLVQKRLFKLRFIEGFKPHEIAKLLKKPQSTVRNHTNIALHTIITALKNRGLHPG